MTERMPSDKPGRPRWIRRLARDRRAGTAIEYALVLAMVALTMIAAFNAVARTTTGMWNNVSSAVINAH